MQPGMTGFFRAGVAIDRFITFIITNIQQIIDLMSITSGKTCFQ
jgi:hypothetical protein